MESKKNGNKSKVKNNSERKRLERRLRTEAVIKAVEKMEKKEGGNIQGSVTDGSGGIPEKTNIQEPQIAANKEPEKSKKVKVAYKRGSRKGERSQGAVGRAAASIMEAHDRVQAAADGLFIEMFHGIQKWLIEHRIHYSQNFRRAASALTVLLLASCGLFAVLEYYTVYEYAYNGRALGYVKDQRVVYDVIDVAGESLARINNDSRIRFVANDNITFRKSTARNKDVDDADKVLNKLTYMRDIEIKATGIYEDGELIAVVGAERTADTILALAMDNYSNPERGMKIEDVKFGKKIEKKPLNIMLTSVQGRKNAAKTIIEGGTVRWQHIVGNGEKMTDIKREFGADADEVFGRDGKTRVDKLEAGGVVTIVKEVKPVTVDVVESGTMSEVIEHKVVKQDSKDYYKGDTHVQQAGVDGRQKITGRITKRNGKIIKRKLKSKEVITPPVDEIILIGITDRPKTAPTGEFMVPVRSYVLSSPFGARWGRMHEGVDLAAPTGTSIYAADGGTVVRAGSYGGYGICLDIDHGNGVLTRYGHCSAIIVNVGDKVYKGQEVAKVGNTGHSTGSHCHFEIRIGGRAIDPQSRLNF